MDLGLKCNCTLESTLYEPELGTVVKCVLDKIYTDVKRKAGGTSGTGKEDYLRRIEMVNMERYGFVGRKKRKQNRNTVQV